MVTNTYLFLSSRSSSGFTQCIEVSVFVYCTYMAEAIRTMSVREIRKLITLQEKLKMTS
jgi:hypothetical protein